MDELELTDELGSNIVNWMLSKYAITTINNRKNFLKSIFKKYNVLNQTTLRKIMKDIKYQHQRACLVMINKYCYDNNINFHLIIPSVKKQSNKLPDILSTAEIKLMIQSAPYPYNLAIRCIFNMGAGLRVSEIIKMQWDDISWVDWLETKDEYGVVKIKSGKGSKDRVVNIPKNLMNDLYKLAQERNLLNEFLIPTGGAIFYFGCENMKKPYKDDLRNLNLEFWKNEYVKSRYDWFRYNILKQCCEKALNKKIKIHSLRHSRSTYLYEVEHVPIEKIQILLGHSSINTTMIYTRINPRSVFELTKNVPEI